MYTPYAYSQDLGVYNEKNMLDILTNLNGKYCNCEMGAAGKEVGYLCPGTCLDYAYDNLNVPYAFAFEIYERGANFKDPKDTDFRYFALNSIKKNKSKSCFIQSSNKSKHKSHLKNKHRIQKVGLPDYECFEDFNPVTEKDYIMTVDNWNKAFFDMLAQIENQERNHITQFK